MNYCGLNTNMSDQYVSKKYVEAALSYRRNYQISKKI